MNTETARNRNAEQAAASESAAAKTGVEFDPETMDKYRSFIAFIQADLLDVNFHTPRSGLFHAPLLLDAALHESDVTVFSRLDLPDISSWGARRRAPLPGFYSNLIERYHRPPTMPSADMYTAAKAFAAGMLAAERAAAERGEELDGITKQSVSMPKRTWEAIKFLADAEGISRSAWLARAADQAATRTAERTRALAVTAEFVEEFEAEHGQISEENYAEANSILDAITGNNS